MGFEEQRKFLSLKKLYFLSFHLKMFQRLEQSTYIRIKSCLFSLFTRDSNLENLVKLLRNIYTTFI